MDEISVVEGEGSKHLIFNDFKENCKQIKYDKSNKSEYDSNHIELNSLLLTVSNKYGYGFIISPNEERELLVLPIKELLNEIQSIKDINIELSNLKSVIHTSLNIKLDDEYRKVNLIISNNQDYLLISYDTIIEIYSIKDSIQQNWKNIKPIIETNTEEDDIINTCKWDIKDENIAITTSNFFYILNFKSHKIDKIKSKEIIYDVCWNPKDQNQLYIGIEGEIHLVDKNNINKSLEIFKNALGDDYIVSSIDIKLDKYLFIQYYKVDLDEYEESNLVIFNTEDEDDTVEFGIPMFPMGNFQCTIFLTDFIKEWDVLLLSANKGSGIEVLGYDGEWFNFILDDTNRISMDPPIVGMSLITCYDIDVKNCLKITNNGDTNYPPVPILFILFSDGTLKISNFFNTQSKGQPKIKSPLPVQSLVSQPPSLSTSSFFKQSSTPSSTTATTATATTTGLFGATQPSSSMGFGSFSSPPSSLGLFGQTPSSTSSTQSNLFGSKTIDSTKPVVQASPQPPTPLNWQPQSTNLNFQPKSNNITNLTTTTTSSINNIQPQKQQQQQQQQQIIIKKPNQDQQQQQQHNNNYSPILNKYIEKYETTSIYNSKTPISQQIKKNLTSIEKYYNRIRNSTEIGSQILQDVKNNNQDYGQTIDEFQFIVAQLDNQCRKNQNQSSLLTTQVLKDYSLSLRLEDYFKDSKKKNYQNLLLERKLDPTTLDLKEKIMQSYLNLSKNIENLENSLKIKEQQQEQQSQDNEINVNEQQQQQQQQFKSASMIYQSLSSISQSEDNLRIRIDQLEKKFNKINQSKEKKEKLNNEISKSINITKYTELKLSKLSLDDNHINDTSNNNSSMNKLDSNIDNHHEINVTNSSNYKNLISILKRRSNKIIKPQSPDYERFFKSEAIGEPESDDEESERLLLETTPGKLNKSLTQSSSSLLSSTLSPSSSIKVPSVVTPQKYSSFSADKFAQYDDEDEEDLYNANEEEEEDYSASNINTVSNKTPIMPSIPQTQSFNNNLGNASMFGNTNNFGSGSSIFGNNIKSNTSSPFGGVSTPSLGSLSTSPLTIASPITNSPATFGAANAAIERERQEKEKLEKEKQEKERLEKERQEKERKEKQEREAKEKQEREAKEKQEKERQEKERKEKQEKERIEKESKEKEAKEKQEREAKEKQEKEAKEKQEKEAKEKKEKEEKERKEKEEKEKKEKEEKEKAESALNSLGSGFGSALATVTTAPTTTPTSPFSTTTPFNTTSGSIFGGQSGGFNTQPGSIFGQAAASTTASPPSTTTVFGQSQSNSPFSRTSNPVSVFGGNASSTSSSSSSSTPVSVFGGSNASPASVFGGNASSTPAFGGSTSSPSTTTTSAFGSGTSTSAFGQTNNSSPFGRTSVFGGSNTSSTSTASVFGSSNTSTSVFGGNTSTTGTFGSTSTPTSAFGSTSPFGSASTTPSTGAFGGASTTPSTGAFGGASITPSTGTFGGTSTTGVFGSTSSPQSSFGGNTSTTPSTGAFGSTTGAFGSTSSPTSAFGSTSTFGSASTTPSTGAFGSTTGAFGSTSSPTSAFGSTSSPTSAFGNTSAFGGATTTPSTGAFGSTSSPQSAFGSTSAFGGGNTSAFGGASTTPTTGAFGSTSSPQSVFGSNSTFSSTGGSVFGSTNTSTPFGGGSVFGGNNTSSSTSSSTPFGGGSVFGGGTGSTGGSVFGQPQSNPSVFGSFGNTNNNQWK